MDHPLLRRAISEVGELLYTAESTIATAESCTGGLLATLFTDIPGSSDWFKGSVVAYSNDIKHRILDVPQSILDEHGAVSREAVLLMAENVCKVMRTDYGVAISGIAGPSGGTPEKPVGSVWIAWYGDGKGRAKMFQFQGDRSEVRDQSVLAAVNGLLGTVRT